MMPNTYPCCTCKRDLPLSAYTPSEAPRITAGIAKAVCVRCKSDNQLIRKELRKADDPELIRVYEQARDRALADDRDTARLPEAIKGKREQRVAAYAAKVAAMKEQGDGRRWV